MSNLFKDEPSTKIIAHIVLEDALNGLTAWVWLSLAERMIWVHEVAGSSPVTQTSAGMMELADISDLKSEDGNIIRVQVPLPAFCGYGGIGRHIGFRFQCPRAYGFKSHYPHYR